MLGVGEVKEEREREREKPGTQWQSSKVVIDVTGAWLHSTIIHESLLERGRMILGLQRDGSSWHTRLIHTILFLQHPTAHLLSSATPI